jgi:hypothetical protein
MGCPMAIGSPNSSIRLSKYRLKNCDFLAAMAESDSSDEGHRSAESRINTALKMGIQWHDLVSNIS